MKYVRLFLGEGAVKQSPLFPQLVEDAMDLFLLLGGVCGFDGVVLFAIVSVDVALERVEGGFDGL